MGLIRKLAVRSYSKELEEMITMLTKMTKEQIGTVLIYSVWLRATMGVEGTLPEIKEDNGELNPELCAYPISLRNIEKMISLCNKKGLKHRAFGLSIWVHTLRSILRPEMSHLAIRMWEILMNSKSNWEVLLEQIRDDVIQSGSQHDFVINVEKHTRTILQTLPPKQLYQ